MGGMWTGLFFWQTTPDSHRPTLHCLTRPLGRCERASPVGFQWQDRTSPKAGGQGTSWQGLARRWSWEPGAQTLAWFSGRSCFSPLPALLFMVLGEAASGLEQRGQSSPVPKPGSATRVANGVRGVSVPPSSVGFNGTRWPLRLVEP